MLNFPDNLIVSIINNQLDFNLLHDQLWYRIPVSSADKWLKNSWPPQWLAFYQTKLFGAEKYAINYYGQVAEIRRQYRWELFPEQPHDAKSQRLYYQIFLKSIKRLPQPIVSHRRRRLIFIPTIWQKFIQAEEINDLYNDSPLEDLLWSALKQHHIPAERQEVVKVNKDNFMLDFAVYCDQGKINVEANGDTHHLDKEAVYRDKQRNNALASAGWRVLRFTTPQIREEMQEYCLPYLAETINNLGGLENKGLLPRKINLDLAAPRQLTLFE